MTSVLHTLLMWRYPLIIAIPVMLIAIGYVIYRWGSSGHLTLDVLKLLFGFSLLIVLCLFGLIIVSTTVTAEASHGMDVVLTSLSNLTGAFGVWAFARTASPPPTSSGNGDKKI